MWNPLVWFLNFIRGERRRVAESLRPFALAVVEDLFNRDFNQDGVVSDARTELHRLLTTLTPSVLNKILKSYVDANGVVRTDIVAVLPVEVLKKVLAIALLVYRLRAENWPVKLETVLKHGYSLLDSTLQAAFEEGRKEP